jgi:hypothetical protein
MRNLGIVLLVVFLAIVPLAFADELPGYTIRHYSLRIEPDFDHLSTTIRTDIEIDNPRLLNTFEFTVRQPFEAVSVTSPGTTVTTTMLDGTLTVKIAKPKAKVHLGVITQAQNAKSRSEDRFILDADSLFLIWSDAFYPIDFDQWAPVRTTLILPEKFQGLAPGHLVSRKPVGSGGTVESVFESAHPQVCFSIFADRRWTRTERTVDGMKLVTLLDPETQKWSEQIFKTSADVLKYFADLHGSPAPEEFAFASIPGMGGRRAFSTFIGYPPKALDREMMRTGYDAHETSLLWWGYTSHGRGPGAWQWNEGLGDYVEFMYGEARNKPLPAIFNFFREAYLSSDFAQEPLYNELRGNTPQKFVHGKYPWLMSALRQKIGDEPFRKGLRKLFADYRYKSYTYDEMFAAFESAAGQSLKKFRADWIERRGVPEIKLEATSKLLDKNCTITGTIQQDGALTGMPLDIALQSGDATARNTITLAQGATAFSVSTPGAPTNLQVDPDNKFILKVTPLSAPTFCQGQ